VTKARPSPARLSLIGLALVLVLAWCCYRPALDGAFQLDDVANLSGLATVTDRASAIEFVLSGTAGPTGRPLALLSFVLQAGNWEQGAAPFIAVNIAIHLLNAALLAACLYLLSLLRGASRDTAALVAAGAAACWVVLPLLAGASLLVVQRMTTLSASFSLLGLLAYLRARRNLDTAPVGALVWMGVSLVLGTLLASLCKETGILLPVYVLVLEATVLPKPHALPRLHWRAWQSAFLLLPLVIVLAYLALQFDYSDASLARRGFTGWQRLLSESSILWSYLHRAILALPSTLGIYQTPPEAARSILEPRVLLATIAWLTMIALALGRRRRWPLFSLAVLWYLGGHLLESTVLPLELYFEHRNYLPLVGPLYAAAVGLSQAGPRLRRITLALVCLYIGSSALLLYLLASMSGDPSTSSRYWAVRYPDSVRAVTTMASYQLTEEGPIRALATLDNFIVGHPAHGYLRIQELNIRCLVMPAEDHSLVIRQLHQQLPSADFTFTAGRMLSQLTSTVASRDCRGVDLQTVEEISMALLENPRYAAVPGYQQFHHKLLASLARQQGRMDVALDQLKQAIGWQPAADLNMMMVTALADDGQFDNARQFIESAMRSAPRNPFWARSWRRQLRELRDYVDELERYSREQN